MMVVCIQNSALNKRSKNLELQMEREPAECNHRDKSCAYSSTVLKYMSS